MTEVMAKTVLAVPEWRESDDGGTADSEICEGSEDEEVAKACFLVLKGGIEGGYICSSSY